MAADGPVPTFDGGQGKEWVLGGEHTTDYRRRKTSQRSNAAIPVLCALHIIFSHLQGPPLFSKLLASPPWAPSQPSLQGPQHYNSLIIKVYAKWEQGLLRNPSRCAEIHGGSMIRNRMSAQCQGSSLRVNFQWQNLGDAINQMIQINITTNERATSWATWHDPQRRACVTLCCSCQKWENFRQTQTEGLSI